MKKLILILILCSVLVGCESNSQTQENFPTKDEETTEEVIVTTPDGETETEEESEEKIDLSGVVFKDDTFEHDGNAKSLIVENLPNGCSVTYENNNHTDVGSYVVSAHIKDSKGNVLTTLTARLTITTPKEPSEEHTCEFSGDWQKDETHHWHECSCGEIDAKVEHSGGEATTETKAVCEECKEEYGELKTPQHTCEFSGDWQKDETHHWHECSCGELDEKVEHSGGEETYTSKAICAVCSEPYGEYKEVTIPTPYLDEETGVVSWEIVEGATHYNYIINGGEIQTTLETTIVLENESNISVQAANDKTVSQFSTAVTFYDTSDVFVPIEEYIYVYFHNTGLAPVELKLGEKVTKPTNLTKANYTFDNFYKDPFYKEVFDFESPIYKSTIIYAKWNPSDLLDDVYYWVKGDSKLNNQSAVLGTSWQFLPLRRNEGQKEYKEFYVTVNVVGASEANPCQFIVMDGLSDDEGRTYWKKNDEDFTIKSDGVYDIYFSVEHQYSEGIHISVYQKQNTARAMASKTLKLDLKTPIISIDSDNNIARWDKVTKATKYEVVINNQAPLIITNNFIELEKGSHISVRALSDVSTSKWSMPKANINYIYEEKPVADLYAYFMGYDSVKVNDNTIDKPTNPQKDGFTFGGWYLDIACTKPATFPYTVTTNTVFYPKWTSTTTYSYNLVKSDGTIVKALTWHEEKFDYEEYKSGPVTLTANTNYYVESADKSQRWGPYKVDSTGQYKLYFSPEFLWDVGTANARNVYIAKNVNTFYFSSNKGWSTVYAYVWNNSTQAKPASWPGTKMTFVKANDYGENIYKIEVDATYDMIIFTNNSGAQTADISLNGIASGTGFYLDKETSGKWSVKTYEYK